MTKNIVVFYDQSFPYDGIRPNEQTIATLAASFQLKDANQLAEALVEADGYIHLHGSYFPKAAWTAILAHAQSGKGMLVAGGNPFKKPVWHDGAAWQIEEQQTAYHQQLQIHESLALDVTDVEELLHNADFPLFAGKESLFDIEPTFGLRFHITRSDDCPKEGGTAGPMDANIYPLLRGVGSAPLKRELAAPAILIENTKGAFSGGRWVLINQVLSARFWTDGGIQALQEWAAFITEGVTELWLKPNYASYEPGEQAVFMIQGQQLYAARTEPEPLVYGGYALKGNEANIAAAQSSSVDASSPSQRWTFEVRVYKADDSAAQTPDPNFNYSSGFQEVLKTTEIVEIGRELTVHRFSLPFAMEAGYYAIVCEATTESGERRTLRQGIWGMDREFLQTGEYLTCDRDYFRKDDRPLPIVGMTYMTSDVARKFVFLPNAAVWDRDMAQMKRAGINMIRTGIWTAHRYVMFVDGHPYEEVLRALDAFFLTAKRYDLEVTFNFFSFTPEAWEGVNPYLDPRSVEAQKRFISAIVSRHADSAHIHWDLINEPSMFDPAQIFNGPRSNQDPVERKFYLQWLRERHGNDIRALQERWNMTPEELPSFDAIKLPEPSEISFRTTEIFTKRGAPWLDYTLFTMDMHNRWAIELIDTIRAIAPGHLATVGQDEGLGAQRPSPFFYASTVDYTTVHSWWKMDDLVWDSIFAKDTDKPNLVQETGIMYVETPDGRAKRDEFELRNILERKYAYSFSTGNAGAVQWIWNINSYMNNINESHIGAVREDGSEKPEADVSYDFGAFMEQERDLFEGRELEEIAVVFPYSNDFSNRNLAQAATTKLIRTLSYEMNVHVRGLGEYHLESLKNWQPKLIVVPSPHNFSSAALETLLDHVKENGGTLLFTGPIDLDEYWRPTNRLESLLGVQNGRIANVLREEALLLDSKLHPVSFGGTRIADSNKQVITDSSVTTGPAQLHEFALGAGKLLWCPLPIELNDRTDVIRAVYTEAIAQAGVQAELEWLQGGELAGIYGRKLTFAKGALYVFVSEFGCAADIEVRDPQSGKKYAFTLESERSLLFATDEEGNLTTVYRNLAVQVN